MQHTVNMLPVLVLLANIPRFTGSQLAVKKEGRLINARRTHTTRGWMYVDDQNLKRRRIFRTRLIWKGREKIEKIRIKTYQKPRRHEFISSKQLNRPLSGAYEFVITGAPVVVCLSAILAAVRYEVSLADFYWSWGKVLSRLYRSYNSYQFRVSKF